MVLPLSTHMHMDFGLVKEFQHRIKNKLNVSYPMSRHDMRAGERQHDIYGVVRERETKTKTQTKKNTWTMRSVDGKRRGAGTKTKK